MLFIKTQLAKYDALIELNSRFMHILYFFLLGIFFISTDVVIAQASSDSLAIIELLEREGAAWRSGDKESFADCWTITPQGRILISRPDGSSINMPASVMANPPASAMGQGGFAFHSNHAMYIDNNSAWVTHDEVSVSNEGKETHSYELRLLQKVAGDWKISGQSGHYFIPERKATTRDTTSYIQTVDVTTGHIKTVAVYNDHFEAPNWHPDNYLIINSRGKIYTLQPDSGVLERLDTGFAIHCNNDHGYSPDGQLLAISNNAIDDASPKSYKSAIYILPITGGVPVRITPQVPSYWHGWSPDGKLLTYTGERNGEFDIYIIGVKGGNEKRLTRATGLDDGPEYSPDGKYIYFNSFRTGQMQIWRMRANGSKPEQLTDDEHSNWFPHLSPDGKYMAYISYLEDQQQGHPFGKQVRLRLMDLQTREIKDLTPQFYGGQGTINVPSWSPDSKQIAFVSYSIRSKTD